MQVAWPSLPAMPINFSRLHYLEFSNLKLTALPKSVALALKSLATLNLAGNDFTCIPTSVCLIHTLEVLDLSNNRHLQLQDRDVDTLAGLPVLKALSIRKTPEFMWSYWFSSDAKLTDASVGVLLAIKERMPHLKFPGYSSKRTD